MSKKYFITQDQFDNISHFKRMFELHAESINDLCKTEKDDVVYGFELGKLHTYLRDNFIDMMNLESEIKKQELKKKD